MTTTPQQNRDRKADAIARYALRLGWDVNTFRTTVGALPYAERGTERTMTGFARAAYRAAQVRENEPGKRTSPTWRTAMQLMPTLQVIPDLMHEAAQWLPTPRDGGPMADDPARLKLERVGRANGPRGWDHVAALAPVEGAICRCGQPAVVYTMTSFGPPRWRCPDCPPRLGEWGHRRVTGAFPGIDWATTPEACTCATTSCYCGRRPPRERRDAAVAGARLR